MPEEPTLHGLATAHAKLEQSHGDLRAQVSSVVVSINKLIEDNARERDSLRKHTDERFDKLDRKLDAQSKKQSEDARIKPGLLIGIAALFATIVVGLSGIVLTLSLAAIGAGWAIMQNQMQSNIEYDKSQREIIEAKVEATGKRIDEGLAGAEKDRDRVEKQFETLMEWAKEKVGVMEQIARDTDAKYDTYNGKVFGRYEQSEKEMQRFRDDMNRRIESIEKHLREGEAP